MAISRFGSRFTERLAAAAQRAEELEAERTRPRAPGELVSEAVADLDSFEAVAQKLSHALARQLNTSGGSFTVSVTVDLACLRYTIEVTRESWFIRHSSESEKWLLCDEDLALHTTTVAAFRAWISGVARGVRMVLDPPIERTTDPSSGWMEAKLGGSRTPEQLKRRVAAQQELLGLGLRQVEEGPRVDPAEEERQAIESIRKVLGDA